MNLPIIGKKYYGQGQSIRIIHSNDPINIKEDEVTKRKTSPILYVNENGYLGSCKTIEGFHDIWYPDPNDIDKPALFYKKKETVLSQLFF